MCKPRLLIISYTNPQSDPRVARQIRFLAENFELTVAGLPPGPDGIDFVPIHKVGGRLCKLWWAAALLCGYDKPYMSRYQLNESSLRERKFDLILVNDADPLPLVFKLAGDTPVFFDAHEYYPRVEESWHWAMLFRRHYTRLCHEYIPRCAGMTTVGTCIAREYECKFGRLPAVVRNVPEAQSLEPKPVSSTIRLIHHGLGMPARKLEQMIDMMKLVDECFTLDFMLTGDKEYLRSLEKRASGNNRIKFLQPVPMYKICEFINHYDLGVYLLPPLNFNQANALPNKFFEFIQARLGIVIGPSPEMAEIVRQNKIGVVAKDFSPSALAAVINQLTQKTVTDFKKHSNTTAKKYNAAIEMSIMRSALMKILTGGEN